MPVDQKRWFAIHFIGMGSYLTLVSALGLLAGHGVIPVSLMWFMLGISGMMFFAAMSIGTIPEPRTTASATITRHPSAEPPIEPFPFRRSA